MPVQNRMCRAAHFRGDGVGVTAHYFVGIGKWVSVQSVNKIAPGLRGVEVARESLDGVGADAVTRREFCGTKASLSEGSPATGLSPRVL
jgi:hypothetical protein